MPEEQNTPQVTEETGGKITIDPHEISNGAWEELWNANTDDDLDLGSESASGAEPVDVTIAQAENIAHNCRRRANELKDGDSQDKRQAIDLREAALYLEGLLPEPEGNTGCLDGLSCPGCNSLGNFKIDVIKTVEMSDNGEVDESGNNEWDGPSRCECCECGHIGTIRDFTTEERGKPVEPPATAARDIKWVFDNTEWKLLRQQKCALMDATCMPEEAREGLISFLDHIQNLAHEMGYRAYTKPPMID